MYFYTNYNPILLESFKIQYPDKLEEDKYTEA